MRRDRLISGGGGGGGRWSRVITGEAANQVSETAPAGRPTQSQLTKGAPNVPIYQRQGRSAETAINGTYMNTKDAA